MDKLIISIKKYSNSIELSPLCFKIYYLCKELKTLIFSLYMEIITKCEDLKILRLSRYYFNTYIHNFAIFDFYTDSVNTKMLESKTLSIVSTCDDDFVSHYEVLRNIYGIVRINDLILKKMYSSNNCFVFKYEDYNIYLKSLDNVYSHSSIGCRINVVGELYYPETDEKERYDFDVVVNDYGVYYLILHFYYNNDKCRCVYVNDCM